MVCNKKLIALAAFFALQHQISAASVTLELGGPNELCGKYTKSGLDYLQITHARVLDLVQTHATGSARIIDIAVCDKLATGSTPYNITFQCRGGEKVRTIEVNENESRAYTVMIGVKVIKQMLSGPIDYRYYEPTMKLIENGFLDVEKLANEPFVHDRHIHVKRLKYNDVFGSKSFLEMDDCHILFPRRLIADHGIYTTISTNRQNGQMYVERMYYEPDRIDDVVDLN